MANHKVKEFFIDDLFWLTSDYISEDVAKTDFFYQLALLFADVTFTDKDNNTIPMDFFKIVTSPTLTTNKNGRWLQCTEEYVKIHSGNKITSDYFDESYDEFYNYIQHPTMSSYRISAQWRAACIAKVIFNKYKENWCRTWYAISEKYRPLDNYDGYEATDRDTDSTQTLNTTVDRWDTNKQGGSSTTKTLNTTVDGWDTNKMGNSTNTKTLDTKVDGWDTSKQGSVTTTTAQDTYGFNSSNPVDKDAATSTSTPGNNVSATNDAIPGSQQQIDESATHNHGTDTDALTYNNNVAAQNGAISGTYNSVNEQSTHNSGTDTDAITYANDVAANNSAITGTYNNVNEGSQHNHGTDSTNTDEDIIITKHGNLGVTTSQQMLASEYEFRAKYNFYNMIYTDIDKILTCGCYGTAGDNMED